MNEECCFSCRFYFGAPRSEIGFCRKLPPVVMPFEWDNSPDAAECMHQVEMRSVYPVVPTDDWCGSFEAGHRGEMA